LQVRSSAKAGAVILIGVVLSTTILIAAGRWGGAFKKKQTLHVLFADVQGLKIDDPVQVMGLELGKVSSIAVTHYKDEAGNRIAAVEVTAKVDYPDAFSKDTKVLVDRTLTGSTVLSVAPGRASEKIAADEKLFGVAPVSMTELAGKAGIIAQRLDDFVADMTDRKLLSSARIALVNLGEVSEIAKSVMASLSRSIPGTEKGLVATVRNFEQISTTMSQSLAGNKDRINETVVNLRTASESLARAGSATDKLISANREPISHAIANADKTSANMKALSREVRWQPWLLLHKPGMDEVRERNAYNAALELSEGAESLNVSVKELESFMSLPEVRSGAVKVDTEKFNDLIAQVHDNLGKSVALERKLLQVLADKAKDKTQ